MTEETKKISFGFSKLKKQSNLVKPVEVSKPQIDYVDSFDGVRDCIFRCDEPVKKELVIPLIGTKTAFEVIRAKLEANNADNQNNQDGTCSGKVETNESREGVQKDELIKNEANKEVSIDDLAAKEILNDLQNNVTNEKSKNTMVIKQPSNKTVDEKEIPIDYENIPVVDFGLAMLRGMGWTPQTGIGKEQKVVQVVTPKLRPKGLGLGADKVVLQQTAHDPDLTISIKGYVKFVNGSHKGSYGQVEAMDDNNGRVIVKLALGGSVSVSEMLLVPVTKKEYEKNSKVLSMYKIVAILN
ncbi:UNVERIFIED_CONTAM: hypothetical protein PYX00_005122 [Menopon gallinae]|uniref:G-patch domain-containing protein n=1 Tax=Menopon gallinae TaxID=328185 RepID=A0AAW2HR73_9NEOP